VNQRAIDLGVIWRSQVAAVDPEALSLNVSLLLQAWTLVRIGMGSDAALRVLAEDHGLDQARTERRSRVWFRQAEARANGLIVIAAGPSHEGAPP
jgi:hypothetical protein